MSSADLEELEEELSLPEEHAVDSARTNDKVNTVKSVRNALKLNFFDCFVILHLTNVVIFLSIIQYFFCDCNFFRGNYTKNK